MPTSNGAAHLRSADSKEIRVTALKLAAYSLISCFFATNKKKLLALLVWALVSIASKRVLLVVVLSNVLVVSRLRNDQFAHSHHWTLCLFLDSPHFSSVRILPRSGHKQRASQPWRDQLRLALGFARVGANSALAVCSKRCL